jgi:methylitaconate Delta-isomerase
VADFRKIACVIQRGGTSKGVYLHAKDLPTDPEIRDKVILAIFGSPDVRQIDGLGGADPLTSKCAIIGPCERPDADINYTMAQVDINQPVLDYKGNCGNISAGVGPFAIDEGLVSVREPETMVRIFNTNTRRILKAFVQTKEGKSRYMGDYSIDGVPGTGSKILLDYSATGGAATGKLLPTGNPADVVSIPSIGKIEISIVDAGNPMCFIKPEVFGLSGIESPVDKKILDVLDKVELIRGTAARIIGFVDDPAKARTESPAGPMLAIVSQPRDYVSFTNGERVRAEDIDFVSRGFFMQQMHKTYAGTGTVCTGTAAMIEGTLVNRVCSPRAKDAKMVRIGHPSGVVSIEVEMEKTEDGFHLKQAAFARTSRRIMEGFVYVPESLFRKE